MTRMEKRVNQMDAGQTVTLTFDLTHDLDFGFSRSYFEIAVSQKWEGQLIWNEKDASW